MALPLWNHEFSFGILKKNEKNTRNSPWVAQQAQHDEGEKELWGPIIFRPWNPFIFSQLWESNRLVEASFFFGAENFTNMSNPSPIANIFVSRIISGRKTIENGVKCSFVLFETYIFHCQHFFGQKSRPIKLHQKCYTYTYSGHIYNFWHLIWKNHNTSPFQYW